MPKLPRVKYADVWLDNRNKKKPVWRARFRKGKVRVLIDTELFPPGTKAFAEEIKRLADEVDNKRPRKGTLEALLVDFTQSAKFSEYRTRTANDYREHIKYLCSKKVKTLYCKDITPVLITRLMEGIYKEKSGDYANRILADMKVICKWGVNNGYLDNDPTETTQKFKRPENLPEANRPWTAEEMDSVIFGKHIHPRLQEMLILIAFTGMRKADAASLLKSAYDGEGIHKVTAKTKQRVWVSAIAPLRTMIASIPPHDAMTLIVDRHGNPWTEKTLDSAFKSYKRTLVRHGVMNATAGLTIHGLRTTLATILKESGVNKQTRAIALGHSEDMAEYYARHAVNKEGLREAANILEHAVAARLKVPTAFNEKCQQSNNDGQ